jgi:hypothetical protein
MMPTGVAMVALIAVTPTIKPTEVPTAAAPTIKPTDVATVALISVVNGEAHDDAHGRGDGGAYLGGDAHDKAHGDADGGAHDNSHGRGHDEAHCGGGGGARDERRWRRTISRSAMVVTVTNVICPKPGT